MIPYLVCITRGCYKDAPCYDGLARYLGLEYLSLAGKTCYLGLRVL
jgi:hypothetical protein